jgi:hypothetical protein
VGNSIKITQLSNDRHKTNIRTLKKLIFLILGFLTVTACFGQTTEKYEPFESFDYASDKYQIKLDSATFSKFKIEIRQAKLLDNTSNTPSDFYCRSWLTIRQGDKIINQQYFKSIEPVGGCYGFTALTILHDRFHSLLSFWFCKCFILSFLPEH